MIQRVASGLLTLMATVVVVGILHLRAFERSMDRIHLVAPLLYNVPAGATARDVIDDLRRVGVITDDLRWDAWVRARRPRCLQAGAHTIEPGLTPRGLFERLCETAYAPGVTITVPEGASIFRIAEILEAAGLADADAVVARAQDPEFLADVGIRGASAEGRLFPDTYTFGEDTGSTDILRRMAERHDDVVARLLDSHPEALGRLDRDFDVSMDGVVTVASLVEAEARVPEERPRVARVLYNRLARGVRLESDPTCVYGPDTWQDVPTPEACHDPVNPYSTYVIDGLPPTPIGNPGEASLLAALVPADEPDVLYFCAMRDGTGRHAFAESYEEHRRNVAQYLRD